MNSIFFIHLFIHPSVDEHFAYLRFLAVINNAAINIGGLMTFQHPI
jgi:hypothetical protein